jgi:hypothetical protein
MAPLHSNPLSDQEDTPPVTAAPSVSGPEIYSFYDTEIPEFTMQEFYSDPHQLLEDFKKAQIPLDSLADMCVSVIHVFEKKQLPKNSGLVPVILQQNKMIVSPQIFLDLSIYHARKENPLETREEEEQALLYDPYAILRLVCQ